MKQLWTTLADRRRPGPAAFRRGYRKLPYATLSFPRWSGTFFNLSGRPGRDPVAAPPVGNLTCNFWVEKNTILEMSL